MKYIYTLEINRRLGSSNWYLDRIYTTKQGAIKKGKAIIKKFPTSGFAIKKWRLYE
jgi:hypothetical protein